MSSDETSPRRHLAAVWFADIVGHTRLASHDEIAALEHVDRLQTLAREAAAECGGRIVRSLGDAVLAEFSSTEAAVRAALLLRERYSQDAEGAASNRLRVGVHVGDVVAAPDGDVHGDGVDVAARLQDACEPGEVLVSGDVWRQLRQRSEYRFTPRGERTLRGMVEPIELFEVSRVRRQLAAVWFTDIVGFTRLSGRREDDALRVVEVFQSAARAAVEEQGGRLIKFLGDGALALFDSAEMAVRSALALQSSFAARDWVGVSAQLRVGIHLADVTLTPDGDVYGDGINIASRIVAAAAPGEILASEDVWRQARRRSELHFEVRGPRRLRGVDEPIELYAASRAESTMASTAQPADETASQREPRDVRSIAVLPFADLSPEGDQQYFADGMAEELLNALAQVARLQVPARTSSFAFRGESVDIREIGSRLGVEAVLEGSVRKAGKQLRITVQLVDANNGFHLWSDRYDRQMEDVFAIQEEIATNVVDALGLRLQERERRLIEKRPTEDFRAYDLYLRGRQHYHRHTLRDNEIAEELYRQAIEADSEFARAWAGLADLYADLYIWTEKKEELTRKAEEAANRALELDPDLAEAYVSLGHVLLGRERLDEAVVAFERALELTPNLYEAHYYYARTLFAQGQFEEAAERFARAHEVRPDEFQALALGAGALRALGREEEALDSDRRCLEVIERHLVLHPDDVRALYLGAGCLVTLGEHGRARGWLERAIAAAGDEHWIQYNVACAYARMGDTERALDLLEDDQSVGQGGSIQRAWFEKDPDLASLHGHPRFQKLLARWEDPPSRSGAP